MNQELTNLDVFVDAWNKFCESVERAKTQMVESYTVLLWKQNWILLWLQQWMMIMMMMKANLKKDTCISWCKRRLQTKANIDSNPWTSFVACIFKHRQSRMRILESFLPTMTLRPSARPSNLVMLSKTPFSLMRFSRMQLVETNWSATSSIFDAELIWNALAGIWPLKQAVMNGITKRKETRDTPARTPPVRRPLSHWEWQSRPAQSTNKSSITCLSVFFQSFSLLFTARWSPEKYMNTWIAMVVFWVLNQRSETSIWTYQPPTVMLSSWATFKKLNKKQFKTWIQACGA